MKTKINIIFAVAITMAFPVLASADDYYRILDVDVLPENPLSTNQITFNVFLQSAQSPLWVNLEQYSQNGMSLLLDLYIDWGWFQGFSHLTYSKEVGCLQPGDYSLNVRVLYGGTQHPEYYGDIIDSQIVNFTVTPEPTTLVLLAIGLPVFRAITRRKA